MQTRASRHALLRCPFYEMRRKCLRRTFQRESSQISCPAKHYISFQILLKCIPVSTVLCESFIWYAMHIQTVAIKVGTPIPMPTPSAIWSERLIPGLVLLLSDGVVGRDWVDRTVDVDSTKSVPSSAESFNQYIMRDVLQEHSPSAVRIRRQRISRTASQTHLATM